MANSAACLFLPKETLGFHTIQQSENQQLELHDVHPAGTVQLPPLAKFPDWLNPA